MHHYGSRACVRNNQQTGNIWRSLSGWKKEVFINSIQSLIGVMMISFLIYMSLKCHPITCTIKVSLASGAHLVPVLLNQVKIQEQEDGGGRRVRKNVDYTNELMTK